MQNGGFAKYRTIFADVDDTICESTQPVDEAMALEINRLIAGGRNVAFISGSTTEQLWGQLGAKLSGNYHLLGASGTHYVRVEKGEPKELYRFSLSDGERALVLDAVRRLARRHNIRSLTTEDDQIQDRGSQITFSAIGRHAPSDLKRSFDPGRALRLAWAAELKAELGGDFHVGIGGTTSVDITKHGLDKGWGLRQFIAFHGLDPAQCLFFGDNLKPGGNDYPASKVVDCIEVGGVSDTLARLKAIA